MLESNLVELNYDDLNEVNGGVAPWLVGIGVKGAIKGIAYGTAALAGGSFALGVYDGVKGK